MKHLLILIVIVSLCACNGNESNSDSTKQGSNDSTELRDWAKSQTSRAEITTALAEAKMSLRLIEQTDPQSADAKALKARIETLEKELEGLKNNARQ